MPEFMPSKTVTDSQRHTAKLIFENLLKPNGFGCFWATKPAARGNDLIFGAGNGRIVINAKGDIQ